MAKYLDPKADVTFKADDVSQDLLDNPQTGEALEIVRESGLNDVERAAYEGFWDRVSIETTRKRYMAEREAKLAETEAKLAETAVKLNAANAELNAATTERDAEKARADAATAERDAAVEKLRQDKLQTARNLKARNLTIEQITAATGLAVDEIEKL